MSRQRYYPPKPSATTDRYEVRVPKRIDLAVRAIATRDGITPEAVVLRLLDAGLARETEGGS
jgi:hypothetical protein